MLSNILSYKTLNSWRAGAGCPHGLAWPLAYGLVPTDDLEVLRNEEITMCHNVMKAALQKQGQKRLRNFPCSAFDGLRGSRCYKKHFCCQSLNPKEPMHLLHFPPLLTTPASHCASRFICITIKQSFLKEQGVELMLLSTTFSPD